MHKQMNVLFAGRVQGVGFRYSVCHIAERFTVTGYVRNLTDGHVEVVAEGLEQTLMDFLRAIGDSPVGRFITGKQVRWLPETGRFERFGISY